MKKTFLLAMMGLFWAGGIFLSAEAPTLEDLDAWGLPEGRPGAFLLVKEHYLLQYNEEREQADWVAYELTRAEVKGEAPRRNRFFADPAVPTGSAALADYRKSGFDRGHLAPAADMKISEAAMADSFSLANMAPQRPGFNRGIWARLEGCVRTWAVEAGALYVVTGTLFVSPQPQEIGENGVDIADYFYKAVLDMREPEFKAAAFLLPHEQGLMDLGSFMISVDALEAAVGIDFFPALEDHLEARLEAELDPGAWPLEVYRP